MLDVFAVFFYQSRAKLLQTFPNLGCDLLADELLDWLLREIRGVDVYLKLHGMW